MLSHAAQANLSWLKVPPELRDRCAREQASAHRDVVALPNGTRLFAPRSWLAFSEGADAFVQNYRCLVYLKVWKSANTGVNAVIRAALRGVRNGSTNRQHATLENFEQPKLAAALKTLHACKGGRLVFTLVREPLQHFVAGYGEIADRSRNGDVPCAMKERLHNHTPRDAAGFLHCLFVNGKSPAGPLAWVLQHVYPQAGVMAANPRQRARARHPGFALDYVGRLERAALDWPLLMAAAGIPALAHTSWPAYEMQPSPHASSSDPLGARAAMISLLRSDVPLRHAICGLIAADYSCFGYLGYDMRRCMDGSVLGHS